jgi:hypothetical protein
MRVIIKETRTSIKPKEDPPLHSFRVWRLHDAQLLQRVPAARRGGNDCKRKSASAFTESSSGIVTITRRRSWPFGQAESRRGEQAGSGPILINDRDGYSIKNARTLLRQLE